MRQTTAQPSTFPLNHQQPRLSENQQLIKPVQQAVCPEAIELLRLIRHRALPVLRGIEQIAISDDLPSQPCYLFDFLPGTSLDQLTDAESKNWTAEHRVRYMAELARVIEFLHKQGSRGLMHLDLKPSNLLLDPQGRPALIDFDTLQFADIMSQASIKEDAPAAPASPAAPVTSATPAAPVACTLGYAAPEVLQGRPCQASDYYSLGLCLIRLLTDYDPNLRDPAGLPEAVAALPPAIAAVAARCLMTDPALRWANGYELSKQLLEAIQPEVSPVAEGFTEQIEPGDEACIQGAPPDLSQAVLESHERVKKTPDPDQPMPKTYSRLLSIWEGAEFGCELAVQLRHYYSRVLVIDGDLIHPQADLLLGKQAPKNPLSQQPGIDNLNLALSDVQRNVLTPGRLRELAWPTLSEGVDLLVFGDKLDDYEHIPPANFLKLIEISRQSYPIVVLLINRFIYDAFTCLGLMTADQVLIPAAGAASVFRSFNHSIEFLALRRQIDPERIRFVAFPYDERTDLSLGTLNVLADNRLLGSVQTNLARQRRRGSARPYACAVSLVNEKEYDGIIARLNHQSHKESPDADRHVARPIRRTIRLLSRQTPASL